MGRSTLTNCTVSGNSAQFGGGLESFPNTLNLLTNCTVSANSGGGLLNNGFFPGDFTELSNTIVAGNTGGPDAVSSFFSVGNNLIGVADGSSGWIASDLLGTGLNPLDPLLAPLGNNGGPTQTMALLHGSPAIDAGHKSGCRSPINAASHAMPTIPAAWTSAPSSGCCRR